MIDYSRLSVVLIRGLNVRGHDPVLSTELLSRLRRNSEGITWVRAVGTSGNLLFENSARAEEIKLKTDVSTQLVQYGIRQPIAVRTLEELKDDLHTVDNV